MSGAPERLVVALAERYRLERELGAGGMATVYLAHDLKHRRDVAVKVLREEVAASVGRERFLREIQLAARLSHPHILPLFDSGDANGTLYYVMPNVAGQSLRDRLNEQRQLPIADAIRIATEVADALDHAHRHGTVHRDVKPENIMLQDGHVLLADFGIGKAVSDTAGDTLTQAGMSVGTPAYMSPEQAVGEEVDGRSDLYSLGCVLYEMIVGEPPFTGPTMQAVIARRFVQTPLDVASLREGVPRSVARTVQKALARLPVDRYETATHLIASLAEPEPERANSTAPAQSLAILPFDNLSADPDNQYFADGIAADILDALVRIDGLQVAAQSSAFSFRGKQATLLQIGEALQVTTVLQGSLRKSGNRMRLTVQLVSVADGYHLWSERFDRELVDVFAVQDEIAAAIAEKLKVTFVPSAQPAGRATTAEVEAFELVAKGRALTAQRGLSLVGARECLQRAIALDPVNADAHAALGDALQTMVRYSLLSVAEGRPPAKAALARALELDPENTAAMATLGTVSMMLDHDPDSAFHWWERALDLQPRLAEVRATYALLGLICVRHDDARGLAELARAVREDPRSTLSAVFHSMGLLVARRFAEAAVEGARACELDPHAFVTLYTRVLVSAYSGDVEGALAAVRSAFATVGRHPLILMALPKVYLARGDVQSAEAAYRELQARSEIDVVPRSALALAADALGREDEAIRYALESLEQCDDQMRVWTRDVFTSQAMRAHPQYPELLQAMGL